MLVIIIKWPKGKSKSSYFLQKKTFNFTYVYPSSHCYAEIDHVLLISPKKFASSCSCKMLWLQFLYPKYLSGMAFQKHAFVVHTTDVGGELERAQGLLYFFIYKFRPIMPQMFALCCTIPKLCEHGSVDRKAHKFQVSSKSINY